MNSLDFRQTIGRLLFAMAVAVSVAVDANAQDRIQPLPGPETETILSTYHVRPGAEPAFLEAINRTWGIYRRLNAVLPRPHLLVKKVDEAGHTTYVEVFTWRTGDIPDHAPSEIKVAWRDLESLCKLPDGKSGIEGEEVTVVAMD